MYEETSINPIKYVAIVLLILTIVGAIILLPLINTSAQSSSTSTSQPETPRFSDALASNTLCSAGLSDCDAPEQSTRTPSILGGIFNLSSSGPQFDPIISIVNIEGQTLVYRIINGRKHSIPTTEIFYSYDLTPRMVQKISAQELAKYQIARLFIVEGTEKDKNLTIYYLTEGGMIRPIFNDKVFYSYGNRKEDVITINQKEFNYYPRNQYIYLERPQINREIYQITGGIKRYLTPVAVKRLNLKEGEIAPVNQTEFDAYPEGEPVIF